MSTLIRGGEDVVKVDKKEVERYARCALSAAQEKLATDVVALDISNYLSVADYLVIATGKNEKQIAAIAKEIEKELFEAFHLKVANREGDANQCWVLLDFEDIVVHIFTPEAREEYRLEKLWGEAPRIENTEKKQLDDKTIKDA